ncbi:hypothetical protein GCM10029964_013650 [Kibdelosporangium lantanae]
MVEFVGLRRTAELIAAGGASSVEVVTDSLDRIEKAQPTLNAFRRLRRDAALAEAAAADTRVAAGERLPLLGVPVAVKDDTDIAGEPTAFGCAGNFPAKTEDGGVVRRLRAAGAVIVGKTNTPEFGQWPFTEGHAFGATRNPWDLGYTPGGSSGGSAAAVAAGLVPAATGSDGLGSIRIPAAWTGLVGVKPTRGLVETAPQGDAWHGLAVHGPLARTVEDAALLLDVIADTGTRMRSAAARTPGKLRIALALRVPFTLAPAKLDPQIRTAVIRLGRVLARLGHEVTLASPNYGLVGLGVFPGPLVGCGTTRWTCPTCGCWTSAPRATGGSAWSRRRLSGWRGCTSASSAGGSGRSSTPPTWSSRPPRPPRRPRSAGTTGCPTTPPRGR